MKELDNNEKAKLGQAINLAVAECKEDYNTEKVIDLVFKKYLPLIEVVRKEYVKRKTAMQEYVKQEEEEQKKNELMELM